MCNKVTYLLQHVFPIFVFIIVHYIFIQYCPRTWCDPSNEFVCFWFPSSSFFLGGGGLGSECISLNQLYFLFLNSLNLWRQFFLYYIIFKYFASMCTMGVDNCNIVVYLWTCTIYLIDIRFYWICICIHLRTIGDLILFGTCRKKGTMSYMAMNHVLCNRYSWGRGRILLP